MGILDSSDQTGKEEIFDLLDSVGNAPGKRENPEVIRKRLVQ